MVWGDEMTLELKNLADLENTHHFTFPMVIMRHKKSQEKFVEIFKSDIKAIIFIFLISLLFFGLFCFTFGEFELLVVPLFFVVQIIYLRYRLKNDLKILIDLPQVAPFIVFDKEKFEIYDNKGVLIKRFKTENIKDFCYYHGPPRRVEHGFEISFKNSFFDSFIYNITKKEKWTDVIYVEHNNNYYVGGFGGYVWLISNMIDMLNKDPNAESFPFRRKNYINQRNWDDP